ncbi:hypothetical protein M3Y96_00818600 [Aphelenchoides besseyi]|nr:hypothetical protein M3Y96_00818600 [Aphelenchoides besseyi]
MKSQMNMNARRMIVGIVSTLSTEDSTNEGYEWDDHFRLSLTKANLYDFNFVCYPIAGPKRATKFTALNSLEQQSLLNDSNPVRVDFSEFHIGSPENTNRVNGRISPWIDCDHPNVQFARYSTRQLDCAELPNADYLGVRSVLIEIRRRQNPNLIRVLRKWLWLKNSQLRFWIIFPSSIRLIEGAEAEDDIWTIWSDFRNALSNYSQRKLIVGIRFGREVDHEFQDNQRANRWIGEPLEVFWFNAQNFAFLHEMSDNVELDSSYDHFFRTHFFSDHQRCIISVDDANLQNILSGLRRAMMAAIEYNNRIFNRNSALDDLGIPFEKQIQRPLQPAENILSTAVYSTFEKHTGKYALYESAIFQASIDLYEDKICNTFKPLVVLIVGAGRGGIISAALRAEEHVNKIRNVKTKSWTIIAVERNPFAVLTLEHMNQRWNNRVQIVCADARDSVKLHSNIKHKADIFVSEMLGSFGCNELEPEVLKVAEREFCHKHSIIIPLSYSNFVEPIHSLNILQCINNRQPSYYERFYDLSEANLRIANKPTDQFYVVPLRRVCRFESGPQRCFTYVHPTKEDDLERDVEVQFDLPINADITAFAGYFDASLYKDIRFSTLPGRSNSASSSWFPALIPLRKPIRCPSGSRIKLRICRHSKTEGSWYEWQTKVEMNGQTVFLSEVQNQSGVHDFMRLPSIEQTEDPTLEKAEQSEILRASRKDDEFLHMFQLKLSDTIKNLCGDATWIRMYKYLPSMTNLFYHFATTMSGVQTLGEEYLGLIQVSSRSRVQLLAWWRSFLWCGIEAFGPQFVDRQLKNLKQKDEDYYQSKSVTDRTPIGRIVLSAILRQLSFSTIQNIHWAIFFLSTGTFYSVWKRALNIKYIGILFKIIGITVLLQYLLKITFAIRYDISRSLFRPSESVQSKLPPSSDTENGFYCDICLNSEDPVSSPCGHIYCYGCILFHSQHSGLDPLNYDR